MEFLGLTFYQGDDTAPEGIVFHYTSRVALPKILKSGVLRPHRTLPDDLAALVWFSTNAIWEPASGRSLLGDGRPMGFDMQESLYGHARIAVDSSAATMGWKEMRRVISPSFVRLASQPGQD